MNLTTTTRNVAFFAASICTVVACVAVSGTAQAGKTAKQPAASAVAKRPAAAAAPAVQVAPRNVPAKRLNPRLNRQGEIEKPGARVEP